MISLFYRLQFWKRRRGTALTQMQLRVKPHWSWQMRLVLVCILGGIALSIVWGVYHYGVISGQADPDALLATRKTWEEMSRLDQQLGEVRQTLAETEQQVRVERAARDSLSRQLTQLQSDNSSLKDQIAFYERLLTQSGRSSSITLDFFQVDPISPGHYRLRAVLTQGQANKGVYKGEVDFRLITEIQNKKRNEIIWPIQRLQVSVARFDRVDQEMVLPEEQHLVRAEVRVYDKNAHTPRLIRSYDVKG